jgi:hypothetical protein
MHDNLPAQEWRSGATGAWELPATLLDRNRPDGSRGGALERVAGVERHLDLEAERFARAGCEDADARMSADRRSPKPADVAPSRPE